MALTEAQVEEAEALKELGNAAFGKNNTSPPSKRKRRAEAPKLIQYLIR